MVHLMKYFLNITGLALLGSIFFLLYGLWLMGLWSFFQNYYNFKLNRKPDNFNNICLHHMDMCMSFYNKQITRYNICWARQLYISVSSYDGTWNVWWMVNIHWVHIFWQKESKQVSNTIFHLREFYFSSGQEKTYYSSWEKIKLLFICFVYFV